MHTILRLRMRVVRSACGVLVLAYHHAHGLQSAWTAATVAGQTHKHLHSSNHMLSELLVLLEAWTAATVG